MELSEEIGREANLVYDAELSGGDYRPPAHLLQYFADEVADLKAALAMAIRLLNQDIPDEEQAVRYTTDMLIGLAINDEPAPK